MKSAELDSGLSAREVRDFTAQALADAGTAVAARREDALAQPDDVECLHQYRISVRVARSLAKFARPYMDRDLNRELGNLLKTLQDPTSRLRELDVLVPMLADTPQLQSLCALRQQQTRDMFNHGLRLADTREVTQRAVTGLSHLEWKPQVAAYGIDAVALACRIDAQRDFCERGLAKVDFDDQEAVHDLRKRAKALRYATRALKQILPEGLGNVNADMHAMQDKLGDWCDARVNAALVAEICGPAGADVSAAFQAKADAIVAELRAMRAVDAA